MPQQRSPMWQPSAPSQADATPMHAAPAAMHAKAGLGGIIMSLVTQHSMPGVQVMVPQVTPGEPSGVMPEPSGVMPEPSGGMPGPAGAPPAPRGVRPAPSGFSPGLWAVGAESSSPQAPPTARSKAASKESLRMMSL